MRVRVCCECLFLGDKGAYDLFFNTFSNFPAGAVLELHLLPLR